MTRAITRLRKPLLVTVLSVWAWAWAGACAAGTLHVSVTDKDGKPAADVVVLVDSFPRAVASPAPAPVVIVQEDLRFSPFLTVVSVGSTLRFVNRDSYDHHVRSTPSGPLGAVAPVQNVEMRLPAVQRKSVPVDLAVAVAGPIGLGCHLHASMRGQVYVAATPWFGKTDAQGVAVIEGVPDGVTELRLWHSDQLLEQMPLKLNVSSAAQRVDATLNFTLNLRSRRRP
jgi:plastocyanin